VLGVGSVGPNFVGPNFVVPSFVLLGHVVTSRRLRPVLCGPDASRDHEPPRIF
jgi:hypothetical protein